MTSPTAAWLNVLLVVDRRLASGELSPEEEAAVRARLKAIEAERASLLSAAAAERDAKLAALDDEESELLRRLESGELTPGKPATRVLTWPSKTLMICGPVDLIRVFDSGRRGGDGGAQAAQSNCC